MVCSASDLTFLASAYDGRWPVFYLTTRSSYKWTVSVDIAELDRRGHKQSLKHILAVERNRTLNLSAGSQSRANHQTTVTPPDPSEQPRTDLRRTYLLSVRPSQFEHFNVVFRYVRKENVFLHSMFQLICTGGKARKVSIKNCHQTITVLPSQYDYRWVLNIDVKNCFTFYDFFIKDAFFNIFYFLLMKFFILLNLLKSY